MGGAKEGLHWIGCGQGVDSTAEADAGQNRVSSRQCQAVTSKKTSSDTCKLPEIVSCATSGGRSHTLGNTARCSMNKEHQSFHASPFMTKKKLDVNKEM